MRYKTKNQFTYYEPSMITKLRWQYDYHVKIYGSPPKRIFITKKQGDDYFKNIPAIFKTGFDRLYYKGKDVITKEPYARCFFRGVPLIEV